MAKEKQTPEEVVEEVVENTEPTQEEKLTAELNETKDKLLRVMAEYDNFRKRSQKEKIIVTLLILFKTKNTPGGVFFCRYYINLIINLRVQEVVQHSEKMKYYQELAQRLFGALWRPLRRL